MLLALEGVDDSEEEVLEDEPPPSEEAPDEPFDDEPLPEELLEEELPAPLSLEVRESVL